MGKAVEMKDTFSPFSLRQVMEVVRPARLDQIEALGAENARAESHADH